MAQNKNAPQRDKALPAADAEAVDYASNMFSDGHNRTATDKNARNAPAYNRAAHTGEAEIASAYGDAEVADSALSVIPNTAELPELDTGNLALPTPRDTFHSRDGTDASGALDEDGGSLGGTTEELDSLEAGGTPVDRNPRMKK